MIARMKEIRDANRAAKEKAAAEDVTAKFDKMKLKKDADDDENMSM
jgi:hypothetical protein